MDSQVKLFWRYFKRNRLAVGGMAIIVITFLIAGSASFIAPYDPGKTDVSFKLNPLLSSIIWGQTSWAGMSSAGCSTDPESLCR